MTKLRALATDLGGSGFFVGLATVLGASKALGSARIPTVTILWAIAALWFVVGLLNWVRRDDRTVVFRKPSSTSRLATSTRLDLIASAFKLGYSQRLDRANKRVGAYIMNHLVRTASRATILTRDLSWVDATDTSSPLHELARAGQLKIISCDRNSAAPSVVDDLRRLGATVSNVAHPVAVRFTLVESAGNESMALARSEGSKHKIIRIDDPHDAIFATARELAASLIREAAP